LEGLAVEDVGIFMNIRFILRPFGILFGHLVCFAAIWYVFPRFGMLYQKNLATLGMRRNKNYDSSFNSSFQRRENRHSLGLGTGLPDGLIFFNQKSKFG
jgi:hypothetical protein